VKKVKFQDAEFVMSRGEKLGVGALLHMIGIHFDINVGRAEV
jgi:hypothetical protein